MALPPIQVKVNLPPELHAVVSGLAERAEITLGEYIRQAVAKDIEQKIHDAKLIVELAERAGLDGTARDLTPKPRVERELPFSKPGNRP